MRILAVDDDDVHLSVLSLMLREITFDDVTAALSPGEALAKIRAAEQPFDCFLLDIDMPGMTGIELCREIRRLPLYRDVPILMLTRLSDRDHMDAAFAAGATDYITKPIDKLEFFSRLRLAKEFSRHRKQIAELGAEIAAFAAQGGPAETVNLTDPLPLDDVIGALDYSAFENLLLRASTEAQNLDVFALKIGNIEALYNTVSAADFRFIVNSVGDAIAEVLSYRSFNLTYAGLGVFAVALRDGLAFDLEDFARAIRSYTPELGIPIGDGVTLHPELHVGAAVRAPFFPRRANLQVLASAIAAAEDAASRPGAADMAGGTDGSARKAPFFGILKAG